MNGKFYRKKARNGSRANRKRKQKKEQICCEKDLQKVSKDVQKFEKNNEINDPVLFNFFQKNPIEFEVYLLQ